MHHVILWRFKEVVQHLDRFCLLNLPVFLLAVRLHKVLMDQFPNMAPPLPILHDQEVTVVSNQVGDQRNRPVRIDIALLIYQVSD